MGNRSQRSRVHDGALIFPEPLSDQEISLSQAMEYTQRIYPSLTRLMFNNGVWIDECEARDENTASSSTTTNNNNHHDQTISKRSERSQCCSAETIISQKSNFQIIPMELVIQIIDFLDQQELLAFSKTCKFIRSYMQNDMYLWPQTVRIRTFKQLVQYCKKPCRYFFHTSFYSDIGQTFNYYQDLIFPFLTLHKTIKLEFKDIAQYPNGEEKWVLYYSASLPFCRFNWTKGEEHKIGSGSTLFSKTYTMEQEDGVYEIDILNSILLLLFKMRKYVRSKRNDKIIPEFVIPHLRCAIRDVRNFFHSNHRLLQLLKAREKEDPQNAPLEKLEEDETDLPVRIVNTFKGLKEDELGHPPLYFCVFCGFKIGGITCSNCSKLLLLDSVCEGSSSCPSCKKGITRPKCCRQLMQAQQMPWSISESHVAPLMKCKKCSFGVHGTRCFTCITTTHDTPTNGTTLEYNGFFKRVWDADVWTCPNSCARKKRGGQYYAGTLSCSHCNEDLITL
ncbi:hypothetical protein C9374_008191 [Naegleria lovaniensis]|uniref:F-box domain-containing protein n=1 Tax=Naegleria lovaniensis TaxID=51637 RepID=A0AA88KFQ8_NAELO|nr:uncharacterized protein C9374_008191 [Naegleria lovaniensis]KAG2378552.1 hypothetical protein C9374_008191 [Naegleria lovaniensis]